MIFLTLEIIDILNNAVYEYTDCKYFVYHITKHNIKIIKPTDNNFEASYMLGLNTNMFRMLDKSISNEYKSVFLSESKILLLK